jgi:hypothetical protein
MALTPPFAQESDLPATLDTAVRARAAAQLTNASQLLLDEDTRGILDDLTVVTPTIKRITIAVAIRAALPAAGATEGAPITQTSWGAGTFNESKTFANPMGDLYLTKAERRQLGFTKQRSGAVDMWAGAYEDTPVVEETI